MRKRWLSFSYGPMSFAIAKTSNGWFCPQFCNYKKNQQISNAKSLSFDAKIAQTDGMVERLEKGEMEVTSKPWASSKTE